MEARLSTRATMEFLKSVPAVRGRLVTSVMSCCPSGHMARTVGSELWTQAPCSDAVTGRQPLLARLFVTSGCLAGARPECLWAQLPEPWLLTCCTAAA